MIIREVARRGVSEINGARYGNEGNAPWILPG
jgi:hypothetical protein